MRQNYREYKLSILFKMPILLCLKSHPAWVIFITFNSTQQAVKIIL